MAGASVYPVDDRIFVRRQENKITPGGLHLTEDSQSSSCLRGVIAAVGPGMPTMDGNRMPLVVRAVDGTLVSVLPGDGVIYAPDVGQEIDIESGKFDVMHFRDVICVLKQDR